MQPLLDPGRPLLRDRCGFIWLANEFSADVFVLLDGTRCGPGRPVSRTPGRPFFWVSSFFLSSPDETRFGGGPSQSDAAPVSYRVLPSFFLFFLFLKLDTGWSNLRAILESVKTYSFFVLNDVSLGCPEFFLTTYF